MEVASEEVFGLLLPLLLWEEEKDAIKVANNSKYGLGASIWTQDLEKAEKLSRAIESGIVTVNNVVISDLEFLSEVLRIAGLVESCQGMEC
jgi:succinate-semialdehyde dehydrogenase/glutarate-semialdehyde dehydrogenase/succinyl-CoA reductase